MALTVASTITAVSLITPAWLDLPLDIVMIGLIAAVGKLARKR